MPVILHFKLKPPLDCFSQQTQSTHVLTHYRSDVPHARVCNVSSFRRINPHIQKPSHTCSTVKVTHSELDSQIMHRSLINNWWRMWQHINQKHRKIASFFTGNWELLSGVSVKEKANKSFDPTRTCLSLKCCVITLFVLLCVMHFCIHSEEVLIPCSLWFMYDFRHCRGQFAVLAVFDHTRLRQYFSCLGEKKS